MNITRFYQNIDKYLISNKVLVIYGPRQVGKTTLLKQFLENCGLKYKLDSGDNIKTQHLLGSQDFSLLKDYVAGYELLAIDEAQKIPNIGANLKILVDQVPNIKIIATGSSSFELAGQIGEPLTGRKITLTLYPIAQLELLNLYNKYELKDKISQWLVFGSYPEIVTAKDSSTKVRLLEEIVYSYLFKDILELDRIKNSKKLFDLLRLMAFQVGNEVSLNELSIQLGMDGKTVARYLDVLEKAFVIYNLRGFSKNLRKEITKKSKYYFYDNGVRNTIISNFNSIETRNDVGQLWENFIFMERYKKRSYSEIIANPYFWRTWEGQEIDLIEEREGKLFAYEFKWSEDQAKAPRQWTEAYQDATFLVINKNNYLEFVI